MCVLKIVTNGTIICVRWGVTPQKIINSTKLKNMKTDSKKHETPTNANNVLAVRLIANFMGWVDSPYPNLPNKVYTMDLSEGKSLDQFRYDESWDELMPVIEKIESLPTNKEDGEEFQFSITGDGVSITQYDDGSGVIASRVNYIGKSKLESAYEVVFEFIKWWSKADR